LATAHAVADERLTVEEPCYTIDSKAKSTETPDC
jgi:hypothetical protein